MGDVLGAALYVLILGVFVAVLLYFVAFLYFFKHGRSFSDDLRESFRPLWVKFPLIAPIVLAALTAYGAVNYGGAPTLVSAALFAVSMVLLVFWIRKRRVGPLDE
ncbi:MAG TPA: hypothetical protein VIB47_00305 [Dehalococcoidia bacterium]|jgi:hypothetical protein